MKTVYMRSIDGQVFETSNPQYHPECENLGGGSKGYAARREYVKTQLRKIVRPNQKVYTFLRSVSSSGMSRNISVFVVQGKELRNITHMVSDVLAMSEAKTGGLRVSGCGMDMGFHVVYSLGLALWPKGTAKPHGVRNGKPDRDGGYALKHEWI